jgi:thiamine biosynthesis lipoprotein
VPRTLLPETAVRLDCFGGTVAVQASGPRPDEVREAQERAAGVAAEVHRRLTRFDAGSELSLLNADPRTAVPASSLLRRFAAAVHWAGAASHGLVDATCLPAVEAAGYRAHWSPTSDAPGWAAWPSAPSPGRWREVRVDRDRVVRPAGTRMDSGGLAKGLAADAMARVLAGCETWVVDCGGDLRLGGTAGAPRTVEVRDPFDDEATIHAFDLADGAVATSGTTRRRWASGHHLIDPRTGLPADTGVVQVTAIAATGLEAEVRAKTALLRGPDDAARSLPDGGAYVTDDGALHVVRPLPGARRA